MSVTICPNCTKEVSDDDAEGIYCEDCGWNITVQPHPGPFLLKTYVQYADYREWHNERAIAAMDEQEIYNALYGAEIKDKLGAAERVAAIKSEHKIVVEGETIDVQAVTWEYIYRHIGWMERYREWEPEWDDHPEAIREYNKQ
jgi:DNA-directed RNA polymerase subunit RPC12/RpoP